ncbi:AsnC family protein [Pseudovibrio sp. W64]|uniref:Lrp/AsnC ligand binding domain-containing protein n=1 Tax=unclassified Pseudovibrio TaxID=2627060 RepID=UPI00070FC9D9|nr:MULTISPECIES: Lrp/AsnC ligand binding domain-containing protein [unclassified Pseudovibrio]KZK84034.1 AsnC family protein [Pseudovibrio sp. Ad13]KZK85832.1 AsnC family protein [Pseudovibrio sp. W64]KZK92974.1 AsnC family protein [Pseudovibrio sp. Ad46]KZK96652.1 AsnC family protein [Pseudovibrio sp. Ad5]KZK97327.1 AsnC family protein [Pseudovibrio sp. W74]
MRCLFVQIKCKPGSWRSIANEIAIKELHSEIYSINGEYDIMTKTYLEDFNEAPNLVSKMVSDIEGIEKTSTMFAFDPF